MRLGQDSEPILKEHSVQELPQTVLVRQNVRLELFDEFQTRFLRPEPNK